MSKYAELSPKMRSFVDEYVKDKNATQAAIRAGYSARSATATGSRLMSKDDVRDAVNERLKEISQMVGVTAQRVVDELAKLAFANAKDYFEWTAGNVNLKPSEDLTEDQAAAVAEVTETTTKYGRSVTVKLHDKLKALDMLAKHLNLYEQDNEADAPDITIVFETYSDDPTEQEITSEAN